MAGNTFLGQRGETACGLKIADLYRLYIDRAQYIRPDSDLDASAQAFCCEIEKAMGIYPNVEAARDKARAILPLLSNKKGPPERA